MAMAGGPAAKLETVLGAMGLVGQGDFARWMGAHAAHPEPDDGRGVGGMMEWLATQLGPANQLSQSDVEQYERLKERGLVLHGQALDDRLAAVEGGQAQSSQQLRAEVEGLEAQVRAEEASLAALEAQRDRLAARRQELAGGAGKLQAAAELATERRETAASLSVDDSRQFDAELRRIRTTGAEAVALASGERADVRERALWTLAETLDAYETEEAVFARNLTRYVTKQFKAAFVGMAAQQGSSQYAWLDVADPDARVLRGRTREAFEEERRELRRLREADRLTQTELSVLHVRAAGARAQLAATTALLADLGQGRLSGVALEDLRAQVASQRQHYTAETAELGRLIESVSGLQATAVVSGDFEVKLARQEYLLKKQDFLIEHLLQQKARREFLHLCLRVEGSKQQELRRALKGLLAHLRAEVARLQDRLKALDTCSTSFQPTRQTVPATDRVTRALAQLLKDRPTDEDRQFLGWASLTERVASLGRAEVQLRQQLAEGQADRAKALAALSGHVRALEGCVLDKDGQLSLTPRVLAGNLDLLQANVDAVVRGIKQLSDSTQQHKAELLSNPVRRRAAAVMEQFFTNPDALHRDSRR